jgi:hypothetical protein
MSRFLTMLLLLPTLAGGAGGQTPRNSCSDCKSVGFLTCKAKECKPAYACGAVKVEHKCDALFGTKCCRGTQRILCPKCQDPILMVEQNAELEARQAWCDAMRKIDKECDTRFSHVETAHWYVHSSIPDWKVGELIFSRTKTAHLFAERLENATIKLEGVTGCAPSHKQTAFILNTGDEKMRASLVKQGRGERDMTFKTMAPAGMFTTRPLGGGDEQTNTDKGLHQHIIHTGTHHVIHSCFGGNFGLEFAPWFVEAMAHWMEIELFKQQETMCIHEIDNNKDRWRRGDWKKMVLSDAVAKADPLYAQLITFADDRLRPRDKAFCWSFVDYMIKAKPKEFQAFCRALKETNDSKKALDKAFGWSTAAFQDKWRDFVVKTYAP